MKENKTSWGKEADWYDSLLSMKDTYQEVVILPNLLRLLDIHQGDRILDIACGQGYFSKAFAERGAQVVGADISSELIKFASQKAGPREKYMVAPADKLNNNIPSGTFDSAVIVLALQNIENLSGAISEASRALKIGGKLFVVLNHPAFRIAKKSGWGFDEEKKLQYRSVEEYLSESRAEIDMHPGSKNKSVTYSFHRPLQLYFKVLTKNRLVITRLEEWNSHRKSATGPRQEAEDKARKEIPLFMLLEARKE